MKYTPRQEDSRDPEAALYYSLEPIAKGLGLVILELALFRRKGRGTPGSVQVRVTVYKDGNMGVDDCSRFHRAILPRLEITFPGLDVYVEVSSPGISRLIKDGSEMAYFTGRNIKCYCSGEAAGDDYAFSGELPDVKTGNSGWIEGKLLASDENGVTLETESGKIVLPFRLIAKAKFVES